MQHGLDKLRIALQASQTSIPAFPVTGDLMRYRTFALAAAAVITFAASASAQQPAAKLEVGKWSGKVTPPDGNTVDVNYDVTYAADTLRITIVAGTHGTFPVYEAKLDGTKLSFKFR